MKKIHLFQTKKFLNRCFYAFSLFLFLITYIVLNHSGSQIFDSTYNLITIVCFFCLLIPIIMLLWYSLKEITQTFFSQHFSLFFWIYLFNLLAPFALFQLCSKSSNPQAFLYYFAFFIFFLFFEIFTSIFFFKKKINIALKKQKSQKFTFYKLLIASFIFFSSFLCVSWITKEHIWMFLFLFLTIASVNDISAYLGGKQFGKTFKFKNSPNKTVEGLLIGIFSTTIFFLTLNCCFHFLLSTTFLNFFESSKTTTKLFDWILILISGIILSLLANYGDIFFSKQKRKLKIKDFGNIFGAHGGFWDRADSHTFVFAGIFISKFFYSTIRLII